MRSGSVALLGILAVVALCVVFFLTSMDGGREPGSREGPLGDDVGPARLGGRGGVPADEETDPDSDWLDELDEEDDGPITVRVVVRRLDTGGAVPGVRFRIHRSNLTEERPSLEVVTDEEGQFEVAPATVTEVECLSLEWKMSRVGGADLLQSQEIHLWRDVVLRGQLEWNPSTHPPGWLAEDEHSGAKRRDWSEATVIVGQPARPGSTGGRLARYGRSLECRVDAFGRFRATLPEPQDVMVLASWHGSYVASGQVSAENLLGQGPHVRLVLEYPQYLTLEGTVVDARGSESAKAQVSCVVFRREGPWRAPDRAGIRYVSIRGLPSIEKTRRLCVWTSTDARGGFRLEVPEGADDAFLAAYAEGHPPFRLALGAIDASRSGLRCALAPEIERKAVCVTKPGSPESDVRGQVFVSEMTEPGMGTFWTASCDEKGRLPATWFQEGRTYGIWVQSGKPLWLRAVHLTPWQGRGTPGLAHIFTWRGQAIIPVQPTWR